jgi:hypothetical protein
MHTLTSITLIFLLTPLLAMTILLLQMFIPQPVRSNPLKNLQLHSRVRHHILIKD